jgi:hypothetical protein
LGDATIADIVSFLVIWRGVGVVLTGHVHGESFLGRSGRGSQEGQVARISEVVIQIVIRLDQGCGGSIT